MPAGGGRDGPKNVRIVRPRGRLVQQLRKAGRLRSRLQGLLHRQAGRVRMPVVLPVLGVEAREKEVKVCSTRSRDVETTPAPWAASA